MLINLFLQPLKTVNLWVFWGSEERIQAIIVINKILLIFAVINQIEWDESSHSGLTNLLVPRATLAYDRESFFSVVVDSSLALGPILVSPCLFRDSPKSSLPTSGSGFDGLIHSSERWCFRVWVRPIHELKQGRLLCWNGWQIMTRPLHFQQGTFRNT